MIESFSNGRRFGKWNYSLALLKAFPKSGIACLTKKSKSDLIKAGVRESQIICSEDEE